VLSKYEQTEDAYAAGNVVQVTPQIAGTVLAVNGDDTEYIEAGKPLIALDKTDSKVAIEQAEAQLAQAVREVRVLFANNAGLQAMADARAVDVERAKADLSRRQGLANTGAISAEEIEHAKPV
jgi:membrane fusion protein (multidrug efflux system)